MGNEAKIDFYAPIRVPFDPRIAGLFPDAVTHEGNLYLPHDFSATKLLRQLGYEVDAPVLTQYEWCGKTPYEVQKKTVAMMTTERRAYVLNGLGTGKTICTLWAYDYLRERGLANKLLVVAPLSTIWFVWQKEIFENFHHLESRVLFGTKTKRLKMLNEDADIYIINHDGISTILDELSARKDINAIVIDELSVYRNGSSQRTKTMRKFTKDKDWVWGLTGSPIPKDVTDIWGQATVVNPTLVPKYFAHLRQDLCYKAGPYKWAPKEGSVEKAFSMLQPSVRFSLDDIIELPEQVIRYVEVPLGKKQKEVYAHMSTKAVALVGEKTIDAMNAGAALNKLLQIALGWVYNRAGETITLDNENRVATIVDNVHASDHKVLVFVPFKSALAGLSAAFDAEGIEHCVVSGDVPAGKRKEIFADFQTTSKYKALLAHPQCLAHGLTLTAADTVIWGGPVTNLEIFMQANGRITRLGQKHKQLVLMIGGTQVERKIYTALGKKESVQNHLLHLLAEASQ